MHAPIINYTLKSEMEMRHCRMPSHITDGNRMYRYVHNILFVYLLAQAFTCDVCVHVQMLQYNNIYTYALYLYTDCT